MKLFPNYSEVDTTVKTRVGKSTIDVYPWNTHLLVENRFNYHPRPVFQSYTAYTPYLENLNFEFINSDSAPQFVAYEFESIDGRYPLFDEPKLNLVLTRNYNLVDTFTSGARNILLLEKKKGAKPVKLEKVREYNQKLSDPIIPKDGMFYEIHSTFNLNGKLNGLLDHAPALFLAIHSTDGAHMYRTSPNLLQSGIFSTWQIKNTEEFKIFMLNHKTGRRIKTFRLQPINGKYFNDEVRITEFKIN